MTMDARAEIWGQPVFAGPESQIGRLKVGMAAHGAPLVPSYSGRPSLATIVTKKAVDQPSKSRPLMPSMAETNRHAGSI